MVNANYQSEDIQIQAFPIAFRLQAWSNRSSFSLNASLFNSTHYSLNVSTIDNDSLSEIAFSVLCFNRQILTMYYKVYVDLVLARIVGNFSTNLADVVTTDMYLYRNGIVGGVLVQFMLNGSQTNPNYFYYNYSSDSQSLVILRGFNHRVRQCPLGLDYYQPSTVLCFDLCPSYNHVDSANLLCEECHYSCFSCSAAGNASACLSCGAGDNRLYSNSSCECATGYYDNSTAVCLQCNSECLTCSDLSGCLSCNTSEGRALSNGSCLCSSAYYTNGTNCFSCSQLQGCLQCSYDSAMDVLACLQCDSATGYTLTNSSDCNSSLGNVSCGDGLLQVGEECDDDNVDN
jgi:hypothetical protein